MKENILAFIVLFVLSIGSMLLIFSLFRKSLRSLLNEVIKISSATTFYLRALLIILIFIALSSVLSIELDLESEAPFMEYVWEIGDGLSSVLGMTSIYLAVYFVLITILVAVLRRKDVQ